MSTDLNWKLRLGFLVHDVSRLRRNVTDRVLKPLNVTRSQWWVLAFLSRRDGMPQVALAEELDLGKVALGGLIDRLEANGLVERRADLTDRRVKRVFLTKVGTKLIKDIRNSVAETEHDILLGIDEADLQVMVKALRAMKENLLELLGGDRVEHEEDDTSAGAS
ncbi:MarR family winged helix-turn-helix transcriptional regulator [Zavarzinia compransoris]|uniref:MarR family transcriptional regulator n=1 Tax=Zavarzinia compransoris TaxID=1264899 RepID=A0A317E401_9PROT|nr:MarR family transcriptional regulator [Zavarzinia compransoris]PWR20940.1 MarR family transcriptional regulator [Zavarzinia compransoris]TDP43968.1 transcriptional regulator [Zavarzinia compransoris]